MNKISLLVLVLSTLISAKSFAQLPDDSRGMDYKVTQIQILQQAHSTNTNNNQIDFRASMDQDLKGFTLSDGTKTLCAYQTTVFPKEGTKDVPCSVYYTVNLYKATDTLGFDYYGFQLRYKGYKNEKENVLAYAKITLSKKS